MLPKVKQYKVAKHFSVQDRRECIGISIGVVDEQFDRSNLELKTRILLVKRIPAGFIRRLCSDKCVSFFYIYLILKDTPK